MVWWSLSKQAMFDLIGGGSELKMAKKSFLFSDCGRIHSFFRLFITSLKSM